MGVPAFFRWISRKYPSVIIECIESKDVNGEAEDQNESNPNGIEFDNLYLDMNNIIHPCTHPEDRPPPIDEDQMIISIFKVIDRIMHMVRPRKLLYLAVDGVAPRAKMNQQRTRRFLKIKEEALKEKKIARVRAKLEAEGAILPPLKDPASHFDSNCITPGTPFMDKLSKCLHYFVHYKLNTYSAWKKIKIILSDSNVPGEGEHKIMDFIRKQRAQPKYDPNTVHCLYGADADLIMLGLATHEPHFFILREEFIPNVEICKICGLAGHKLKECRGLVENPERTVVSGGNSAKANIFIRLAVLREYLKRELEIPELPFSYDFERLIDDWVFLCTFIGNDFLPNLPSLIIREGALDRLVNLYKKAVHKTEGYLTENGNIFLKRVQVLLSELGAQENEIFKERRKNEETFKAKANWNKIRPTRTPCGQNNESDEEEALTIVTPVIQIDDEEDEFMAYKDEVRLWEPGFKNRYYKVKFDVNSKNKKFKKNLVHEYVKGLCWVSHYYYQGCPSWNWFFSFHYAPFASDFVNIASYSVKWKKSFQPFTPLEQLMSVFPPASKQHVPVAWRELMDDPFSPIIDFYPTDFKIDLNGHRYTWQGVVKLPFINEKRLHKALAPLYPLLSDEEVRRNLCGENRLYVGEPSPTYLLINKLYEQREGSWDKEVYLDSDGIHGRILPAGDVVSNDDLLQSPIHGLDDVPENKALCVLFKDPKFAENHIFSKERLEGTMDPVSVLKPMTQPFPGKSFKNTSKILQLSEPDHKYTTPPTRNMRAGYAMENQVRLPNPTNNNVFPPHVLSPHQNVPSNDIRRNWKPQIGTAVPTEVAFLGAARHRIIRNSNNHGNFPRTPLHTIPLPLPQLDHSRGNDHRYLRRNVTNQFQRTRPSPHLNRGNRSYYHYSQTPFQSRGHNNRGQNCRRNNTMENPTLNNNIRSDVPFNSNTELASNNVNRPLCLGPNTQGFSYFVPNPRIGGPVPPKFYSQCLQPETRRD